ncbi:uncharacterized protein [Mytilus edulis]|uniref:CALM n=1 Tax=Mytilus edulis TaxID=6550 RepID=A0A8S3U6Z1_MYTED|nr:CALM [Mytilus edulis]
MAENFSEEHIAEIREIFSLFDKDCDGCISTSELGPVLRSVGLNPTDEEISELVHHYDKNQDMKVEFAELLMEVAKKQKENAPETDDYLLEAFRTFDIERSGKISISTLKEAMINHGERLREEEINEMVAVASDARTDDENIIDYEKFVKIILGK